MVGRSEVFLLLPQLVKIILPNMKVSLKQQLVLFHSALATELLLAAWGILLCPRHSDLSAVKKAA